MKNLNLDDDRIIASSPSPVDISQKDYLDGLYGPEKAVIIDALMFGDRMQVRFFGEDIPDDIGVHPTVPIRAAELPGTLVERAEVAKRFTWSHAMAFIPVGQDMTALQEAIIAGGIPVLSAIDFADEGLQLVLRIDAANVMEYCHRCNEVWAKLTALGVEGPKPDWASASFLPKAAHDVRLLYFNPGLAA